MSYTAKRRLEEMEACGLEGKNLRKSVQIQSRIAQKMGLTSDDFSSKYKKTLLEQSNYLSCGVAQQPGRKFMSEVEKLEELAMLDGLIGSKM